MRKTLVCLLVAGCILFIQGVAFAAEMGPVEIVADGCKKEIETFCKDVIPGEGRILACLYAREDKLSGRCEYALYDAAAQLERAITALTYLANECREDLRVFCSDIRPGEGRLVKCIDKNKEKVSLRCKQAIRDVTER